MTKLKQSFLLFCVSVFSFAPGLVMAEGEFDFSGITASVGEWKTALLALVGIIGAAMFLVLLAIKAWKWARATAA